MNEFKITTADWDLNEAYAILRRGKQAYINVTSFDGKIGSVQISLTKKVGPKGYNRIELDLWTLDHNFSEKGIKLFKAAGYQCTRTGLRRNVLAGTELLAFEQLFEDVSAAEPDSFELIKLKHGV